jgi:hypothetical protein
LSSTLLSLDPAERSSIGVQRATHRIVPKNGLNVRPFSMIWV